MKNRAKKAGIFKLINKLWSKIVQKFLTSLFLLRNVNLIAYLLVYTVVLNGLTYQSIMSRIIPSPIENCSLVSRQF